MQRLLFALMDLSPRAERLVIAISIVVGVSAMIWGVPENVIPVCEDGGSFKIAEVGGKKYLIGYGPPQLLKGDGSWMVRLLPCD